MTYLLKTKRKYSSGSRLFLTLFVVVVALVLAVRIFAYPLFSRALVFVGTPFWAVSESVGDFFSNALSIVSSKQHLIEVERDLRAQLKTVQEETLLVSVLREENAYLKELLGRSPFKRSLLAVVKRGSVSTPYDTFLIDVGKNFGVVSGARVSVGAMIVGEISEVAPTWSRVRLFSSPGEEHHVRIGKTGITATAVGLGLGNFDARIPREIDVVSGDVVVFAEIDKQVIGVVEVIDTTPNDSFQRVLFKSPINSAQVEFVEVELIKN